MDDSNIINHLFDKNITCPVCGAQFTAKVVKVKSPRMKSKDSDFFVRYSVINPYCYDTWICNSCGYAAIKSDFEKIKSFRKDLVLKNVTPKWKPRHYPDILDEKLAIERYKLALLNAMLIDLPDSAKAIILLRIAWMYRLLENDSQEKAFLKQAIDEFSEAYTLENFPMYGLQRDSLTYLLGDLNRRIGNFEQALLWYSKTFENTNASYKIKELARSGKNLIKENTNI